MEYNSRRAALLHLHHRAERESSAALAPVQHIASPMRTTPASAVKNHSVANAEREFILMAETKRDVEKRPCFDSICVALTPRQVGLLIAWEPVSGSAHFQLAP